MLACSLVSQQPPQDRPCGRLLTVHAGGGPRTYPGGVTKWQWKRMLEKKQRKREKLQLAREREEYEAQRRQFLRVLRGPEKPWEDWSKDRKAIEEAFSSQSAGHQIPGGASLGLYGSATPPWMLQTQQLRRRYPWEAEEMQNFSVRPPTGKTFRGSSNANVEEGSLYAFRTADSVSTRIFHQESTGAENMIPELPGSTWSDLDSLMWSEHAPPASEGQGDGLEAHQSMKSDAPGSRHRLKPLKQEHGRGQQVLPSVPQHLLSRLQGKRSLNLWSDND